MTPYNEPPSQYELLAQIDKLPKFIRVLAQRYGNAPRQGFKVTESMKWAAALYRRWLRARQPDNRREDSQKMLEKYHSETKAQRAHRRETRKKWYAGLNIEQRRLYRGQQ